MQKEYPFNSVVEEYRVRRAAQTGNAREFSDHLRVRCERSVQLPRAGQRRRSHSAHLIQHCTAGGLLWFIGLGVNMVGCRTWWVMVRW